LRALYRSERSAAEPEGQCNRAAYGDRFLRRLARPRPRFDWGMVASLVAVIAAFGGGAMWGGRAPSERADLVDEVAGYHQIYSRETRHLVEVPADQIEELTAWLGKRLERDVKVPDLAVAGFRFAGGRMLVINERPVAELMYTRDQGFPIAVCISRFGSEPWPITVEQRGAQRVASWMIDGYAYVVVGEIDDPMAQDIAERVAAQIKS
jgi:anti-sigma factor RsiW